jgi:endonuclease G, mitochondrial
MKDILDEIAELVTVGDVGVGLRMLLDVTKGLEAEIGSDDVRVVRVQMGEYNRLQRAHFGGELDTMEMERRLSSLSSRVLRLVDFLRPQLANRRLPQELKMAGPDRKVLPAEKGRAEALIGDYLQSIAWMEYGLRVAKAICKIQGPANTGSGFLISGNTLITNNHVLPDEGSAASAKAIFNFEEDLEGGTRKVAIYELDATTFATDARLDCTMIKVKEATVEPPVATWGQVDLRTDGSPLENEPVTIIQHPLGAPKKIGILGNMVVEVETPHFYYTTDTMRGSSGSPVLDTRWRAVGLHRAAGRWSRKDERYLNNQGVLMSEISQFDGFGRFLK